MKAATFRRVHEHLSSEGIFLMGDTQQQGFPIRYASPGFEQAYGYKGQEIVGRKCGDLIGGPMILGNSTVLAAAAAASGRTLKDAEAGVRFLVERAGEACHVMLANPGDRVGAALLLNRKKSGALFVCECLLLCLQHPTLSWSYCVGFQRDVTKEVSIPALFAACASPSEYSRLLQGRAKVFEARRSTLLGVGSENVLQYLHEKALAVFSLDIWLTLRTELLSSGPGGSARPAAGAAAAAPAAPAAGPTASPPPGEHRLCLPGVGGRSPGGLGAATRGGHPPAAGALGLFHPEAQGCAPLGPVATRPGGQLAARPTAALPVRCGGGGAAVSCDAHTGPRADERWQLLQSNPAVAFLTEAGLFQYAEPMLLAGFDDLEAVLHMDNDDIEAVGFTRGHGSKLKRKIREFKCLQICAAGPGVEAPCPAPQPGSPRRAVGARCAPSPGGSSTGGASGNSGSQAPSQREAGPTAVERSWERVRSVGVEALGEAMMRTFFRLSPEAEDMFSPEACARHWDWDALGGAQPSPETCRSAALRRVSARILNIVGSSVAGEHDVQQLVPMLLRLGVRHGAYGAREEHFSVMGRALLSTLREVLGEEDFPAEAEKAWSVVFGFVSATMLAGAEGTARPAEPTEAKVAPKQVPALAPAPVRGCEAGQAPTLLQRLHGSAWESESEVAGSNA